MALGIYLNGTTGAVDGTLEVPGDQNGLMLDVIGATATFHMRCPSGYQNAEQITVTAPTDCEVSTDGVTYGATAVYAVGDIQDTNVACFVKRTAATVTTSTWTGLVTTPRLASVTTEFTSFSVDYSDNQSHLPVVAYGDAPPVYAGGRMVLYAASPGVSHAQVDEDLGLSAALKLKETHTFTVDLACIGCTLTPPRLSVPLDILYGPTRSSYLRIDVLPQTTHASITDFAFVYFNTAGVETFWNGTSWQSGRATSYTGTNQLYRFVVETTSTQFRFRILSTTNVLLAESPWVNWSSAKAGYDSGPITFRVLQLDSVKLSVSKISMS